MCLVLIPTYNEAGNVVSIINKINSLDENLDILFIDDNSPDNTGKILEDQKKIYKNINIIHRNAKSGIGSAHVEGINWCYDNGYKTVITMDCDFTHSPEHIKLFLDKKNEADLVIGSRFISKGGLSGWSIRRKIITNIGHILTKIFLNINYDCTGAFRLYNISVIPKKIFNKINSDGYSFFFKSVFIINYNNFKIKEVPIVLSSRAAGNSKMKLNDAFKGIFDLLKIFILKIFNKSIYKI